MKIDRQSRQLAKKFFRACRKPDGSIDEAAVRGYIQVLGEQKPRNYISIMTQMVRLFELALEENTVRIESATPLADKGASVIRDLETQFGPASRTTYTENPALLGGLRIRRGNNIWDGSLSGRLDRLQQALS